MIQFLFAVILFAVAATGMALALHFSRYKKRPSGCCGGLHCDTKGKETSPEAHSCYSQKMTFVKSYDDLKSGKPAETTP